MTTPDGPSNSVLVRRINTIKWIINPFKVLEKRVEKYGESFTISKNLSPLVVYFTNPQAIEQIFTTSSELFDTHSANDILLPLLGENSMILLGAQSINANGNC